MSAGTYFVCLKISKDHKMSAGAHLVSLKRSKEPLRCQQGPILLV